MYVHTHISYIQAVNAHAIKTRRFIFSLFCRYWLNADKYHSTDNQSRTIHRFRNSKETSTIGNYLNVFDHNTLEWIECDRFKTWNFRFHKKNRCSNHWIWLNLADDVLCLVDFFHFIHFFSISYIFSGCGKLYSWVCFCVRVYLIKFI